MHIKLIRIAKKLHLISTKKMQILTDEEIIRKSKFFNASWYLSQYPDVKEAGVDPVRHFYKFGWKEGRNPGPNFNTYTYQLTHKAFDTNPLLDFEKKHQEKINPVVLQKKSTAIVSQKAASEKIIQDVFSKDAESFVYKKGNTQKVSKKVAIFASYSADCCIHEYVVSYLRELKKAGMDIVFIADNPLIKSEFKKIKPLVIAAKFERHGEYDFGSYKRGLQFLNLDNLEELLLCNDSVFGPLFPLANIINKMNKKNVDFWGMLKGFDETEHLQSWFIYFKEKVIRSGKLEEFFTKVKQEKAFMDVVRKYEFKFTKFLNDNGFTYSAFINDLSRELLPPLIINGNSNQTLFPLTLIKNYHFPFIKIKFFTESKSCYLKDNIEEVLECLRKFNAKLYKIVLKELNLRDSLIVDEISNNSLEEKIKRVEVVSFDCFDTLLIRPYVVPTDLFIHMEHYYNQKEFAQARILAEKRASSKKRHITLDDIYKEILPKYEGFKERELFFEKLLLIAHPKNKEIYDLAKKHKKRIVVTSNMYFSSKFLKEVLIQNGFKDIEEVFVSNEMKCSKSSGLYKKVLKTLKITPDKMLHIGDNFSADIEAAQSNGVDTYYTPKYMDIFGRYYGNSKFIHFFQENLTIQGSVILSQIARHNLTANLAYWEEVGYSLAGPLILGYVLKIIKEIEENRIDTLLFVARDGYLLQKAYNLLVNRPIENHYIYASRLINLKCFGECADSVNYFKKFLKIVVSEVPSLKKFQKMKELSPFILAKYSKDVYLYLKANQNRYLKYLKKEGIRGNRIASVDMTTAAFSSQLLLSKCFKNRYLFGIFSGTFKENLSLKYITYKKGLIHPHQTPIMQFMELLVSAPEYPINAIDLRLKPVYNKKNIHDDLRVDIIKEIEIGALNFIQDIYMTFGSIDILQSLDFDMETAISLIDNYRKYLSALDCHYLKKVYHSHDVGNEQFTSLYDVLKV